MSDRDTLAKLHEESRRADRELRHKVAEMDEVEQSLERLLKDFEADEREREKKIDAAWSSWHAHGERHRQ